MISSRLSPSICPDHDFPSLSIPVDHPLYFTDDRLGTLLRNAQNPRRIERRRRPAVIDSDRLPHVVIIRRAGYLPLSRSLRDFDREGHDFSRTVSPVNFVIPSGERSSARRMILRSRGTCCPPPPPR